MKPSRRALLLTAVLFFGTFSFAAKSPVGPMSITVDATDARRNVFHAMLSIPAAPGPLTLFYPEWIPGEHAPNGAINDLLGLKFSAGERALPWRRDDVNMFAFHIDVPQGTNSVEVALDYVSPDTGRGFSSTANATEKLMVVSWNQVLLYPEGYLPKDLICVPRLKLPAGWKYGTALEIAAQTANVVEFRPVSLSTLIDSPVISGAYFGVVPLASEITPPHRIDIAADSEAALAMTPGELDGYHQMVRETGALFGARHYRHYDFLWSMSDHVAHFGLEHHESSDDRTRERVLIDGYFVSRGAGLLTHEFVHSWNGKFRRPVGLATPDYQQPMRDELLWVYEGLTEYLGEILAARSGLYTPDEFRQHLAITAAEVENNRGREWRPLVDTSVASPVLLERDKHWEGWRRSTDYYGEGELIWLEVDTIVRRLSSNRHSMDDFCHIFYGGPNNGPEIKTYSFEDVINTLNQIVPQDWRNFFQDHIYTVQPHAPLGGIENAGWKLVYDEVPGYVFQGIEAVRRRLDARYSIGLRISTETNLIEDVIPGSPAFAAGLGPGMRMLSVNGRQFTPAVLHTAISASKNTAPPILIEVQNGEFVNFYRVEYHGGEKYPALRRNSSKPDVLADIIRAHAPKPKETQRK